MTKTYSTVYDATQFYDGLVDALEALLDKFDSTRVVGALALVAYGKANHVRVTWQDETLARKWEKLGNNLEQVAMKTKTCGPCYRG